MSLLILNSNSTSASEDFTIDYKVPFKFKKIALQSFSMWVSWNNISEGNNTFKFYDGSNWIVLTIPDGNYTIRELNQYMLKYFKDNDPPIQFGIIRPRQRVSIKLKENYEIDLRESEFHSLIGFESKIYKEREQEGKYIADISNGNDNIYIHCDIVEGAYINQYTSEVIYSFTNSKPPGSQISQTFDRPIFFNVKHDEIYRIRMRITNQRGELIKLNKQEVEYNFITENEENYSKKIYDLLLSRFFSLNK